MLKLPVILWGVGLALWGTLFLNLWLLIPGLVLLALGLFFFRWDFALAEGTPEIDRTGIAESNSAPELPTTIGTDR